MSGAGAIIEGAIPAVISKSDSMDCACLESWAGFSLFPASAEGRSRSLKEFFHILFVHVRNVDRTEHLSYEGSNCLNSQEICGRDAVDNEVARCQCSVKYTKPSYAVRINAF